MLIVFKPNGKPTRELWERLQTFGTIAVTDFDYEAFVAWDLEGNLDEIIDIIEEYADMDAEIAI
jgi:hypothetical protein